MRLPSTCVYFSHGYTFPYAFTFTCFCSPHTFAFHMPLLSISIHIYITFLHLRENSAIIIINSFSIIIIITHFTTIISSSHYHILLPYHNIHHHHTIQYLGPIIVIIFLIRTKYVFISLLVPYHENIKLNSFVFSSKKQVKRGNCEHHILFEIFHYLLIIKIGKNKKIKKNQIFSSSIILDFQQILIPNPSIHNHFLVPPYLFIFKLIF